MNMTITNISPISPESLDNVLNIFGEVSISFDKTNIKLKVEKIAEVNTIYKATAYVETSSLEYYEIGYIERNFLDEIINTIIVLNKFSVNKQEESNNAI